MEERRWDEEGVKGTDADQCMSSCSFWSLGLLLPASSRNTAGAGLCPRTPVQQQQQHMLVQTSGSSLFDLFLCTCTKTQVK